MNPSELTLAQKTMLDMGSVWRTEQGVSLKLPTNEEMQKKHPHITIGYDDWKVVAKILMGVGHGMGAVNHRTSNVVRNGPVHVNVAVGLEARIRELKGEALIKACKVNGVKIEVHPTNGGITAMRRKNALLTLFRHGKFKQTTS